MNFSHVLFSLYYNMLSNISSHFPEKFEFFIQNLRINPVADA